MGRLADYLAREAVAAGVEVLTEARATPARVAEAEPEVVVVASGAVPLVPSIPGVGMPHVFTAHQVLEGEVDDRLGRRVAVIGGGLTGVTAAEYLLKRDREVVIVEMQDWIMTDGTVVEQRTLTQELSERGVLILVQTKVEAITSRGLVVTRGGEREVLAADCVVLAAGVCAEREILAHLDVDCVEVHVVGDAEQPRRLMQALLAGATVGGRI
jgi:pyruvate/2-oxoglutarate dehydrogenase complex dihydrolipoamide dehydrogenase (E3) component